MTETGQCGKASAKAVDERGSWQNKLLIVTGLSGAGKSTALSVLEDLGYFTIDGLPASLAPEVASIMKRDPMQGYPGMAIGMDLRQDNFLDELSRAVENLKNMGFDVNLLFLEANTDAIIRRYSTTRRPHPLEKTGLSLDASIAREREQLAPAREKADTVLDSSNFSIHDLRRHIQRKALKEPGLAQLMRVNIISFGFKHGLPEDADFVFDLRFLPNPYFVPKLRDFSGKDKPVSEYIFQYPEAREFMDKTLDLLRFSLARMAEEGRYRVTIAFGCTGGRHRSVAMAEAIAGELAHTGYPIAINHRHIDFHSSESNN